MKASTLRYYDFFAGAGLTGVGLRDTWECIWANDMNPRKAAAYRANFGAANFFIGDVGKIAATQLPVPADLAWASFPCQDLSLAGWRKGLSAERSGAFWAFWRIMRELRERTKRPPMLVIENVPGLLYGDNFSGLCEAIGSLGMQFGALVIDAKHFVPQSRPRVFLVAVDDRMDCSSWIAAAPQSPWSPDALLQAYSKLSDPIRSLWRWWKLAAPPRSPALLDDVIEDHPTMVQWHTAEQTETLLRMMSSANRAKVENAVRTGAYHAGFLYKRIRQSVQRAEVRFDGIAGCLRTPSGGSSRQTVVIVDKGAVRTRLLSPREAARLMGVPDSYVLPGRYNDAYQAMGDGVVVPVVSWLSENLLRPMTKDHRHG